MLKKLLVSLLSMMVVAFVVFSVVALVFFMTPSRKARSGISLPSTVTDPETSAEASTESSDDSTYDNIYIADVHQSLTLRTQPDSNSSPVMEEGLASMTKMQVIQFVDNTNFAYVEVINGPYTGYTGYVNRDYITRLGEPTIRVGNE